MTQNTKLMVLCTTKGTEGKSNIEWQYNPILSVLHIITQNAIVLLDLVYYIVLLHVIVA